MRSTQRRLLAALLLPIALAGASCSRPAEAAGPVVTVYKSPTCGCCSNWVDHLREHGFQVEAVDVNDLPAVKQEHGVPAGLASCHTAIVDGYAVEGHVPADVVRTMLENRPAFAGIAVPGMPLGSPGMESPTGDVEAYDTLLLLPNGGTRVFARHP